MAVDVRPDEVAVLGGRDPDPGGAVRQGGGDDGAVGGLPRREREGDLR